MFQCNDVCAGVQDRYVEFTEQKEDHNLCLHRQAEEVVKHKVDRHGQEEVGGWKLVKCAVAPYEKCYA